MKSKLQLFKSLGIAIFIALILEMVDGTYINYGTVLISEYVHIFLLVLKPYLIVLSFFYYRFSQGKKYPLRSLLLLFVGFAMISISVLFRGGFNQNTYNISVFIACFGATIMFIDYSQEIVSFEQLKKYRFGIWLFNGLSLLIILCHYVMFQSVLNEKTIQLVDLLITENNLYSFYFILIINTILFSVTSLSLFTNIHKKLKKIVSIMIILNVISAIMVTGYFHLFTYIVGFHYRLEELFGAMFYYSFYILWFVSWFPIIALFGLTVYRQNDNSVI